jgi:hypothetical protein
MYYWLVPHWQRERPATLSRPPAREPELNDDSAVIAEDLPQLLALKYFHVDPMTKFLAEHR